MAAPSVYEPAMLLAIAEAKKAEQISADVPVGAVILDANGQVIAVGRNQRELNQDPLAHAEIEAIKQLSESSSDWRFEDCTLVVTLEPCIMCAGAIVSARIPRVVFGAWDERVGAGGSLYDLLRDARLGKPVEVISGVLEPQCKELLTQFFETRRMSGSK
jgi:tRNA(adenine34) deaminase